MQPAGGRVANPPGEPILEPVRPHANVALADGRKVEADTGLDAEVPVVGGHASEDMMAAELPR